MAGSARRRSRPERLPGDLVALVGQGVTDGGRGDGPLVVGDLDGPAATSTAAWTPGQGPGRTRWCAGSGRRRCPGPRGSRWSWLLLVDGVEGGLGRRRRPAGSAGGTGEAGGQGEHGHPGQGQAAGPGQPAGPGRRRAAAASSRPRTRWTGSWRPRPPSGAGGRRRPGDGGHVVGEGPEQVLLDGGVGLRDRAMASATPFGSPPTTVRSLASTATSVPPPRATPTSGLGQGQGVVDAVADHGHHLAGLLAAADLGHLVLGQQLGDGVHAELTGDGPRRRLGVAGEQDRLQAEAASRSTARRLPGLSRSATPRTPRARPSQPATTAIWPAARAASTAARTWSGTAQPRPASSPGAPTSSSRPPTCPVTPPAGQAGERLHGRGPARGPWPPRPPPGHRVLGGVLQAGRQASSSSGSTPSAVATPTRAMRPR